MILPPSIELPNGKFRDYLLTPQDSGDKSAFLALAGYSVGEWQLLLDEVRQKSVGAEAAFQKSSVNGDYYELDIGLTGPNGKKLPVTARWLDDNVSGNIRFITLFPRRRRI